MSLKNDSEIRELYRSVILEHAKNPRHFGRMDAATHTAEGINPVCGDKLQVFLSVNEDIIDDASFEGAGCAISLASASLMTDQVIGMAVSVALENSDMVERTLQSNTNDALPDALEALKGVREFPSRVKCATLAWHAFDAAVKASGETARTE